MRCDRCGGQVAKIRVHWPDGAICGICFTTATHTRDLRLKRLVAVFADSERPESIYTWKRGIGAHSLLTQLGTRELTGSHNCFTNYSVGFNITGGSCNESGSTTSRALYSNWDVNPNGTFIHYNVSMTATVKYNGTISGYGATVG